MLVSIAHCSYLKESSVERSIMHARSAQFKRMLVDAGFPLMASGERSFFQQPTCMLRV